MSDLARRFMENVGKCMTDKTNMEKAQEKSDIKKYPRWAKIKIMTSVYI